MTERAPARHRADHPCSTPLSGLTSTITAATLARGGVVVAVSSGIVAAAGLPASAAAAPADTTPSSALTASVPRVVAAPAAATLSTGPVAALPTAHVAFEHSAVAAVSKRRAPAATPAGSTREVARLSDSLARAAYRQVQAEQQPVARAVPAARTATSPVVVMPAGSASNRASRAGTRAPAPRAAASDAASRASVRVSRRVAGRVSGTATTGRRAPGHHADGNGSGSTRSTPPTTGAPAARTGVVATALRYLGVPYRYGGTTPRGFDCSGFTQYVFAQAGVSLPRTADQQLRSARRISRSQARAGDLVFFLGGGSAYHVGIYLGDGRMIDAPRSGEVVTARSVYSAGAVFGRV